MYIQVGKKKVCELSLECCYLTILYLRVGAKRVRILSESGISMKINHDYLWNFPALQ